MTGNEVSTVEIIYARDYEQLSKQAARYVYQFVASRPKVTLGLPTGETPIGFYRELVALHRDNPLQLDGMVTFNLDEYLGLPPQSPQSYHFYMNRHLFEPLGLPLEQTHIPNGLAKDPEAECQRYEEEIRRHGGLDLVILGVGRNGHIGFNEPGTSFDRRTHVVTLAESTRQANARFFPSLEEVPTQAITMGIATILEADEIILLASGPKKAEAVYHLIEGHKVTEQWPVTALKRHDRVTVFLDREAAALLSTAKETRSP
ncbi:glucosamine-6-phosphate deaminase [Caldalkalibacillus thermarum]|uniref:glucosamine-6-phosphate deaminase n=1 Tax=Caldalkalibacillus thermarum TaxID=296745 RepID=UPI00166ECA56|nr:glucosamine-6-phosphate deaminase [Caldalkalibacillus thermarum]